MNRIAMAALMLCLIAIGCTRVGPAYRTPVAQEYDEWTQRDERHISNSEDDQEIWAAVFDDPRLQKLTDLAIEQNYSLKAAAWRISEARALLQIATGQFFPQLQEAFGSWEKVKVSKNAPNTRFADKKFRNADIGFAVAWELDFWGRYRSAINSAEFVYQASETDYFGIQLILTADIAKTYISLCTALDLLAVVRENIRLQQRSLEIIRVRLEAGLVSELDLQQAQVLLSNTEAQLPLIEKAIVNHLNALAILIGTTPGRVSDLLCMEDLSIPFIPVTVAVGVPADLLCRRPDLNAARQLILAQTAIVGVASTELLPQISVFGIIGFDAAYGHDLRNTNANRNLFSVKSLTYAFGPDFRWPLLNYGRIMGRIDLEWARLETLIEQYQNLVLQAYQEAENAMAGFAKAHDRKAYLETAMRASLRAYGLSQELYREGLVDYERVLEAQRALLSTQDQFVANNGDIALFFVQIYQALGGTIYEHTQRDPDSTE